MISGVWTALITPFEGERLDEEGLRQNLSMQRAAGVNGVVALGTTGEAPTLSQDEKERIVTLCAQSGLPLMVGTGSNCTKKTVVNTRIAKELGADYALIVTPYYNKPTQEGIFRHFTAVADAVDIPIVIYNHPGRTGVMIELETFQRLAGHPRIVAVKEASGNLEFGKRLIELLPTLPVLSGDDALTGELMHYGGAGVVSVLSNLCPDLMLRLVSGESPEMLTALFEVSSLETNPIPIKAMMMQAGLPAGYCRLPLTEPRPETKEKIQWCIETLALRA